MKQLAAEGRTILVSSHLMNEMAVTADHLIVIGRGQADRRVDHRGGHRPQLRQVGAGAHPGPGPADRTDHRGGRHGRAGRPETAAGRSPQPANGAELLTVTGLDAARIGELAASASVVLHELTPQLASLEEAFMELTSGSVEFGQHSPDPRDAAEGAPSMTPPPTAGLRAPADSGAARPRPRVGFGHALLAEWTKIRSVRSTVWTLVAVRRGHRRLHRADHLADRGQLDRPERGRSGTRAIVVDPVGFILGAGLSLGQLTIVRARRPGDHHASTPRA